MSDAPRVPPRFVPTLTEVVDPVRAAAPVAHAGLPQSLPPAYEVPPSRATLDSAAMEQLEDQILHRVMQRVDLSLERRLREAVATMVLQHTQHLVPRLREEIEFVVRQAVAEAVADELAVRPPS